MKLSLNSISRRIGLSLGLLAAVATVPNTISQVKDPIPESINPGIVTLELVDYSRVPQSFGGGKGWARINHLKPDGMGRLFVNDLRGRMYQVGENQADLYLDLKSEIGSNFDDTRGLGGGFTSFAFDPDFATNGKFYTAHSEVVNGTADFKLFAGDPVAHGVLIEWTCDDPSASTFSGVHRELMRVEMKGTIHTMQEISFNTAASPSSDDYGNLYVCIGDSGTTIAGYPENTSRLDSVLGTILRIDPDGTNSANGKYGILPSNPFASDGDDNTLGEIWSYGHRNPHRISWDANDETKMFEGEIGEKTMEEVNLIEPGRHYGWNVREGNYVINADWENNPSAGEHDEVFPLPANDAELGYTYPVALYDRDEGRTLIGGYVYRGSANPDFQGQYIFGDLYTGFYSFDADTVVQSTPSVISRAYIKYNDKIYSNMKDITTGGVDNRDPDFRFGYDENNELFIISKYNGRIYKVAGTEVRDPIDPTLVNISTRGDVGVGSDSLIGGFVINGDEKMTVLIQGVGNELASVEPSLDGKTLNDVHIGLYDLLGKPITTNDDWEDEDAALKRNAMNSVGSNVLETGSKSSSILIELEPGQYTVILSGVNSEEGIALVEVYEVDDDTTTDVNYTLGRPATATTTYGGDYVAGSAVDGDDATRWASQSETTPILEVDLGTDVEFNEARILEYAGNRISDYVIEYFDGANWELAYTGGTITNSDVTVTFDSVVGSKVRLRVVNSSHEPSIHEFQIFNRSGN